MHRVRSWKFFNKELENLKNNQTVAWWARVHGDSPDKNTRAGFHALLQGIFSTQGSNPGLLHYRWILYANWATREALNREKNTITERKNILEGINRRQSDIEEWISKLSARIVEITDAEQRKKNENKWGQF